MADSMGEATPNKAKAQTITMHEKGNWVGDKESEHFFVDVWKGGAA